MPLPKMQTVTHTSKQYWNLPEGQRAELIDGHLYAMAPPGRIHQKLEGELYYIIKDYIKSNNGSCDIYPAPFAVNLDAEDKNWVEPDISVICDPNKLTDRGCTGAPDWIVEIISPRTSSHDYIRKLNLYAKAGVKEYWIIDPRTEKVFVYHLDQADVNADSYTFQDKIKVNIYDDLWIGFAELEP